MADTSSASRDRPFSSIAAGPTVWVRQLMTSRSDTRCCRPIMTRANSSGCAKKISRPIVESESSNTSMHKCGLLAYCHLTPMKDQLDDVAVFIAYWMERPVPIHRTGIENGSSVLLSLIGYACLSDAAENSDQGRRACWSRSKEPLGEGVFDDCFGVPGWNMMHL